ncbi:hypothetical protein [Polyangium sp. 6x1]|uniref:3-hydroxyacyl-ACP dehydratase FabZ family protein n=1 Tax=Polyangium sp. 6x1 TaxID=3042689 RepID=UPI0024824E59|nr:hypothetical protein [Polyangium sp. 6x1]MDI1446917.1 hypothetical protein [Polyangium sp. 6x1]
MSQTKTDALSLGAAVVMLLLPQRPPLLLVDRIEGYSRAPRPTLHAARAVSVNEPFFSAELPTPPVLPRSLALEGIVQAANLLQIFVAVQRELEAIGRSATELVSALRNADVGYRLEPGFTPGLGEDILAAITMAGPARTGAIGASQLRFLRNVFPGDVLTYEVRLIREGADVQHFEAEVEVRGQPVAQGMFSLSKVEGILR